METIVTIGAAVVFVFTLTKLTQWGQKQEDRIDMLESQVDDLEKRTGVRK